MLRDRHFKPHNICTVRPQPSIIRIANNGHFHEFWGSFVGVLVRTALLLGVYLKASQFLETPKQVLFVCFQTLEPEGNIDAVRHGGPEWHPKSVSKKQIHF